jgi:hypothetical protein
MMTVGEDRRDASGRLASLEDEAITDDENPQSEQAVDQQTEL